MAGLGRVAPGHAGSHPVTPCRARRTTRRRERLAVPDSAGLGAQLGVIGSSVARLATRPSPDERPVSRRPIQGSTNSR